MRALTFAAAALLAALLAACLAPPAGKGTGSGGGGLELLEDTVEQGAAGIEGTVVNRGGKLSYAQIVFGLYDADARRVGNAMANVAGLGAGERWRFKASALGRRYKEAKLDKLEGW